MFDMLSRCLVSYTAQYPGNVTSVFKILGAFRDYWSKYLHTCTFIKCIVTLIFNQLYICKLFRSKTSIRIIQNNSNAYLFFEQFRLQTFLNDLEKQFMYHETRLWLLPTSAYVLKQMKVLILL